jgi:alpha-mannosidase
MGVRNHKNLEVTDECLLLFGNGDGGGGPTSLMLEKLERFMSLGETEPEVPKVRIAKVSEFFDHISKKTHAGKDLPTWRGELYFELHRGVSLLRGFANTRLSPHKQVSRRVIEPWRSSYET